MSHEGSYASTYAASSLVGSRTHGVLSRRLVAYLVDLVVIGILVVLFGLLIGVAGVVTLGLSWGLYAVLVPARRCSTARSRSVGTGRGRSACG